MPSRVPLSSGSQRTPRFRLLVTAGLLPVAVAAGGLLAVWWLVADVEDARRGSLAWHLALPRYLTSLPVRQACDEPHYSFHGIDGARPQTAAVRYRTRLAPDEARATYAPLLAGCDPERTGALSRWRCDRRDYGEIEIEIGTEPHDACRRIDVRFIAR